MDRDEVEIHKNTKRELGQYPAILTEQAWSITHVYLRMINGKVAYQTNTELLNTLGVLLLPLDGMLVQCTKVAPSILFFRLPWQFTKHYPYFAFLGGERHCESTVSCPRTQHNDLARAQTRNNRLTGVWFANHKDTATPTTTHSEVHIQYKLTTFFLKSSYPSSFSDS